MIDFERHIAKLLLNNDCVIVPGFGGFMAHHMDAWYDADSHQFYPPRRTLGFNPQLTMNDSLLVQSFVEFYDISYPEALGRIDSHVDELKHILETEGQYEMCGLGTIALNTNGKYDFTPCEAGILTPGLYGLGAVDMPRLEPKAAASEEEAAEGTAQAPVAASALPMASAPADADGDGRDGDTASTQAPTRHHTRAVPFWLLRDMAAACIVLMAIILLPTPTQKGERSLSSGQPSASLLLKIMPKDITTGEPKAQDIKLNSEAETATVKPATAKTQPAKPTADAYTIVLASRVSRSGAEEWVRKLQEQGYSQAAVHTSHEGIKVVYGRYATHQEAHQELQHITDNAELAGSWILHITNN